MRLIDADALKEHIKQYTIHSDVQASLDRYALKVIEEEPTVDAVPVERDIPKAPTDKQLEEDGYGAWGSLYGRCPNCRESVYEEQNYCEKCGQRLDWAERKDE